MHTYHIWHTSFHRHNCTGTCTHTHTNLYIPDGLYTKPAHRAWLLEPTAVWSVEDKKREVMERTTERRRKENSSEWRGRWSRPMVKKHPPSTHTHTLSYTYTFRPKVQVPLHRRTELCTYMQYQTSQLAFLIISSLHPSLFSSFPSHKALLHPCSQRGRNGSVLSCNATPLLFWFCNCLQSIQCSSMSCILPQVVSTALCFHDLSCLVFNQLFSRRSFRELNRRKALPHSWSGWIAGETVSLIAQL